MNDLMALLRDNWDFPGIPLAALAGALIGHLWGRFRSRMISLRYDAKTQSLALSGTHSTLGQVKVTHNGETRTNLYLTAVEISNDSTRDVTDLEVQIGFRDGTRFLTGIGTVEGSLRSLPLSSDFTKAVEECLALDPKERSEAVLTPLLINQIYDLPVLNRGQKAIFAFLVDAPHEVVPEVQVNTQHEGVRLRRKPPRPQVLGVRNDLALGVGLIVALGIMSLIGWSLGAGVLLVMTAVVVGRLADTLGALTVRLCAKVVRFMS